MRWIKNKTIAETIINPLARKLTSEHDLIVKGGCVVQELVMTEGKVTGLRYKV